MRSAAAAAASCFLHDFPFQTDDNPTPSNRATGNTWIFSEQASVQPRWMRGERQSELGECSSGGAGRGWETFGGHVRKVVLIAVRSPSSRPADAQWHGGKTRCGGQRHSCTHTVAHGQRRWERGTWQGQRQRGGFVKREPGGEEENDAGGVPAKVE